MKIIGVAGRDRSGKDTVAELLIEHGFFGYSFGDAVRRHALKRHAHEPDPISVKNMTETANWLRAKYGADVILKEALSEYEKQVAKGRTYNGIVLFSIRAPIEVDFILKRGGELVWIEAADQVRYKRKLGNMREGEAKITLQEMLNQEALQANPQPGIPREVQMDLNYVKSQATIVIENNGNDLQTFKNKVKTALKLND